MIKSLGKKIVPFVITSTSSQGLTTKQVAIQTERFGYNETQKSRKFDWFYQLLLLFRNPLVLILLTASVISIFMGETINASIIIVIILLSIILNFIQDYRSSRAAEELRREVALTATVYRDKKWIEIPRREVVPGDVIRLIPGDLVPADAFLFHTENLNIEQASLTGESYPTPKQAGHLSKFSWLHHSSKCMVFMGTSVSSGSGKALVIATGASTVFGEIAERLSEQAPMTEFDHGLRQFGNLILITVICLICFIVLIGALLGRNLFDYSLFAIALAVGLTPEFLPMITTITLTHGALRMVKHKVIIKKLPTIQNFGSIDILCSDKTGTLTRGKMELNKSVDPLGNPSDLPFFQGYLNSFFGNEVYTSIKGAIPRGMNPLDLTLLNCSPPQMKSITKVAEIPFDFERRCMSVVVKDQDMLLLLTKGAPESVIPFCSHYQVGDKTLSLDENSHKKIMDLFQELSSQGHRILAVAHKKVNLLEHYSVSAEKEMVFTGFLLFDDLPLEKTIHAIKSLYSDGVVVKILTGDNELVTRHLCSQVGLEIKKMLTGQDLDKMDDHELLKVVEETTVFSRVSPTQKNRIVLALKTLGHVVGYIGDGINDAPSLHSADVGISVSNAVDVAKEAADVILLERNLNVIHAGIMEGRKAFGNVMKYIMMGSSSNYGNVLSMAIGMPFLPFLPMLPTQILLNNFLYDIAQISIPSDNVDPSYIHKPKKWNIGLIRKFMLLIGPISSCFDLLTFYVMLSFFKASEALFHTAWFLESLFTQTLVIFIIRTSGNPFRSRPSLALSLSIVVILTVALILPHSALAPFIGFVALPATFYWFLGFVVLIYLGMVELAKRQLKEMKINGTKSGAKLRANQYKKYDIKE